MYASIVKSPELFHVKTSLTVLVERQQSWDVTFLGSHLMSVFCFLSYLHKYCMFRYVCVSTSTKLCVLKISFCLLFIRYHYIIQIMAHLNSLNWQYDYHNLSHFGTTRRKSVAQMGQSSKGYHKVFLYKKRQEFKTIDLLS